MPTAIVVTRDVEDRHRGFVASLMLEIAPGAYVAPDLSASVRRRVWKVLSDCWAALGNGSLVSIWRDPKTSWAAPNPSPGRAFKRDGGRRRSPSGQSRATIGDSADFLVTATSAITCNARGSPARAGIDPRVTCDPCREARLPRMRGDRPVYWVGSLRVLVAPPHARG